MKDKTKYIFLLLANIWACQIFSQTLFTRAAEISIYSKTPLETVDAVNRNAVSVFSFEEARVEFSVLIKGFLFENSLMQTHFNENYIHSDEYPKSEFKSDPIDLGEMSLDKDGEYQIPVSGTLTVRGKSQPLEVMVDFVIENGKMSASTQFKAIPQDYGIEIPSIVRDKIAKNITISVDASYEEYEKQ